jgi:glycosyltransferase involved in cell wall biosynthesis
VIIAFPHPPGAGGPGSFQSRFEAALRQQGWQVVYARDQVRPDIVMVVGGTKEVLWLLKIKLLGIPILYRLDGINWLHKKRKVSAKSYLLSEYRNWNNKLIHAWIADYIVYQSDFVRSWWDKEGWKRINRYSIIYNGVDLSISYPYATDQQMPIRLVVLEGTIDYTPYAIQLLNELRTKLPSHIPIELYGKFEQKDSLSNLDKTILYKGFVKRDEVVGVLQSCIYLSLDIHPACPNTVIEALSCGSPVVAFDTGALKELVTSDSGIIVPYGGDAWELVYPNVDGLIDSISVIQDQFAHYADAARKLAKERFDLKLIVDQYVSIIDRLLKK